VQRFHCKRKADTAGGNTLLWSCRIQATQCGYFTISLAFI
jgi:hypothetical protein